MKPKKPAMLFILALIVIFLSQIMCDFPQGKDESKPLSDNEIAIMSELNNETVDISNTESLMEPVYCNGFDYSPPNFQVESYEFRDNRMIITNGSQMRYYERDSYGQYCRYLRNDIKECITTITGNSYTLVLSRSTSPEEENWENCQAFKYDFTNANPSIAGEGSSNNDLSPFTGEGENPQPEADPDPEPEYAEPSECNASGLTGFSLSPVTTETSPSNETTCEYSLTVTNTGDQDIVVFKHISQVYYTGEDDSRWEKYVKLSPGESYSWDCYHQTRNDDGTFTYYIIDAIAPIFDTDGCINTVKNNSDAKEEIKLQIPISCH